jgi:hypothetical protein
METKTFVLSDETLVNSYGFRVMTAGINISQFKENPVMLFNHRSWGDNYKGPIGRWENIRKEKGQLLADAVFDSDDDMGGEVERKVANDFIKSASLGFYIIERSADLKYLLPGQQYPTVTKCKAVEASVVDIPSNDNCLALYDSNGTRIELKNPEDFIQLQMVPLKQQATNDTNNMEFPISILALLGLKAGATEEQVIEKITALKADADEVTKLRSDALTNQSKRVTELVADAVASGKITKAQEDSYTKLANAEFDSAKAILDAIKPVPKPMDIIQLGKKTETGNTEDRSTWTYKDWSQKDPKGLAKLKAESLEEFQALRTNYGK